MNINEKYKLVFDLNGRILTFTGIIIQEDEMFVTFKDRYNKILSYNKSKLISFEEISQ